MNRTSIFTRYFLAIAACTMIFGCRREIATQVHFEGGPVPIIALNGSGRLAALTVYGPPKDATIATGVDPSSILWQIKSSSGYLHGAALQELNAITYGQPPTGYTQTAPAEGRPIPIRGGKIYYLFAETTNAPVGGGFFRLSDGRVEEVKDLCVEERGGVRHAIRCGTNEPYPAEAAH